MSSPSSSSDRSPHTGPKVCTACDGPMRGHTRVNRKIVCPTPEKMNQTLHQLWDEGHQEFVLSIAKRQNIPFTLFLSPPVSPSPPTLAQRLRQRRPLPHHLKDDDEKSTTSDGVSVAGSIRRMLSVVIDKRSNPRRDPSPTHSVIPPRSDIDVPTYELPSVGIWDADKRKQLSVPPELEDFQGSERGSMVPTLLIGSDGETIREGSRAEAHFRAQAALDARLHQRQPHPLQQAAFPEHVPLGNHTIMGHSVIQVDEDESTDTGYYEGSGFLRVLRSVVASPAIVALPVRPEDIPRVRETATRQGLFTAVLPPNGSRISLLGVDSFTERKINEDSNLPIVVIGRDPVMTQRYVEMSQRGVMPDTIAMNHDTTNAPRLITTTQLIFIPLFTVIIAWLLFFLFSSMISEFWRHPLNRTSSIKT
ncbi:hypothetical protein AGABI2DRAFT_122723 [Agaricus bisporus var. bisporus H97]|uniref:hypothetical protein n=1 Tax=Agaricus bisporus var. bisporus (strain H97 / ATCC MYA-4626 / FGSC 10389) TaxID=936046 RepID=UPI00029F77BD|nr:hypothetical protein AGABI2DRAFT_122723 [Agaricus bisporus var. bisporus H97]EKV42498.1 hypothetical protein AGABI2DRAFT_122723 [Agaricus bisporus var. bisporus H97]